ncbi:twin-arginine translocase subunit TatC [Halobaculum limi]|uniref:twin-arginine translocase subunit TatC n=1 Tax=Halobaculum limi TaxID=3031916 RepID=UPI002405704B|nr:twin-arginine translocase subunit TatC [Halobaculum sp. YSMS11]
MTTDSDPPEEPPAGGDDDTDGSESTTPTGDTEERTDDTDEWDLDPEDSDSDPAGDTNDDADIDGEEGDAEVSTPSDEDIDRRSPYEGYHPDDELGKDGTDDGTDVDAADDEIDDEPPEPPDPDVPQPTGIDGEQVTVPADPQPVPDGVAGEQTDRKVDPESNGQGDAMTAAQKGMNAVNEGMGALGGDGPDSDQEMPLTAHIEEMMRRLGVVFGVAGVVVVAVLLIGTVSPVVPSAEEIIEFLWDAHVGFEQNRPRVYGPLEFLLTKLKVASLAGLLVGLPVFVYETYRFMRPGLYPNERRYYLAAVPTSLILGLIGVAFAHFIVLPTIFNYFISYTEESAVLAFSLRETFNLILLLMGYMAIVFQIPLFIQLAIMMGLVTRQWMEDRRLLFWSAFVGLAFIVSPDPTGMAPIIVGATMIVLFEGTLALLRWTGN